MTALVIIGAGKFALEVGRYVGDSRDEAGRPWSIAGYLAMEGEAAATPSWMTSAFAGIPGGGRQVVVALSDPELRTRFFAEHGGALQERTVNIVHPTAMVAGECLTGRGNIIGPHCYFGVNTTVGSFNVFNYFIAVGHHSAFGDRNFISPGFQCGNSVQVGSGNFFGLSCTLGPNVKVGSGNRLQAGTKSTDNLGDNLLCHSSDRVRTIRLPGDASHD